MNKQRLNVEYQRRRSDSSKQDAHSCSSAIVWSGFTKCMKNLKKILVRD